MSAERDTASAALAVRGPVHVEATVRVLQRRPTNLVDTWETDRYRRVLMMADGPTLVEVENRGTIDDPALHWMLRAGELPAADHAAVQRTLRRVLGLDVDPQPLQAALSSAAPFGSECVALRGMRPPRFASLFDTIINVVPFQQLSLDAGAAILGRLVERYGSPLRYAGRRYFAFPGADAISRARLDSLRSCGLSTAKATTLRTLARMIASGELTEHELEGLSTAEAKQRLIELPGVGPWSAAVVLLRGMGRLEVFPPGDAGALRTLRLLLGLPPSAPLEPVIERFGEQRGYLYFCLLGRTLMAKGLIHGAPRAPRNDGLLMVPIDDGSPVADAEHVITQ